jgi:hypothetical protein
MKIEEIQPITTEVDEYTFGQELLDIIKYTRNSECMVCTIAQGLIMYTMKYHMYMKKNKKTKMVSTFVKSRLSEIYRIHTTLDASNESGKVCKCGFMYMKVNDKEKGDKYLLRMLNECIEKY